MRVFSDKDGVIALTRKEFDMRIRRRFPLMEIVPEILPSYELLGHFKDDSGPTALYFRALLGKDAGFDFKAYLKDIADTLRDEGIWRDLKPNIGIINFFKKLRTALSSSLQLTIITAGGSSESGTTVRHDTRLWLDRTGLDFATVIHDTEKEKYLDADVWVEDMPSHLIKLFESGYRGRILLADQPYNKPSSYLYRLSSELISRISRIYPTTYISRADYRSCILDYILKVGRSTFIQNLRNEIQKAVNTLETEGFRIEKNRNDFKKMLPEIFEQYLSSSSINFAPELVFTSPAFERLVSLIGTTEAGIVVRKYMDRFLQKTLSLTNTESERIFVKTAISDWENGWGVPVQFEYISNVYPLNMDSVALTLWAHNILSRHSSRWVTVKSALHTDVTSSDRITQGSHLFAPALPVQNEPSIEINYLSVTPDMCYPLNYLLDQNGSFKAEMNCGTVLISVTGEKAALRYSGPRWREIEKLLAQEVFKPGININMQMEVKS